MRLRRDPQVRLPGDEARKPLSGVFVADGRNDDHVFTLTPVGWRRHQMLRCQEAIDELKRAVELSGRSTESLAGLAQAYATALMTDSMETLIQELVGQTERYVSPYNIARVYAAHRDPERAFEWLERAYEERNPDLIELQTELVFDSVRGDSRFAGLARRIGFEWHSLSRIKTI